MGVSAEAHRQDEHPVGQVPPTGSVHCNTDATGPGISQQSCPWVQQKVPQQNWPIKQISTVLHAGTPQWPLSQNGGESGEEPHKRLQSPQLLMSLFGLMQVVPQHLKPPSHGGLQGEGAPAAPPVRAPPELGTPPLLVVPPPVPPIAVVPPDPPAVAPPAGLAPTPPTLCPPPCPEMVPPLPAAPVPDSVNALPPHAASSTAPALTQKRRPSSRILIPSLSPFESRSQLSSSVRPELLPGAFSTPDSCKRSREPGV
jgi:hypothetical protein